MKKIYCLVNKHSGNIIMASKTRSPLEEEWCDMFMNDYWCEMRDAADSHWINVEDPSEDCHEYARECWDRLMSWHKEVFEIQKVWLS